VVSGTKDSKCQLTYYTLGRPWREAPLLLAAPVGMPVTLLGTHYLPDPAFGCTFGGRAWLPDCLFAHSVHTRPMPLPGLVRHSVHTRRILLPGLVL
jgi:hypothetical protein